MAPYALAPCVSWISAAVVYIGHPKTLITIILVIFYSVILTKSSFLCLSNWVPLWRNDFVAKILTIYTSYATWYSMDSIVSHDPRQSMLTSCHGKPLCITGPLWRESIYLPGSLIKRSFSAPCTRSLKGYDSIMFVLMTAGSYCFAHKSNDINCSYV